MGVIPPPHLYTGYEHVFFVSIYKNGFYKVIHRLSTGPISINFLPITV